jgi:flagella basal body P-ring formation protein FlgA
MTLYLSFALAISACLPVEGDRILMRDLAAAIPAFANADQQESIGFAPAPGAQRRFSVVELSRLAASHGITEQADRLLTLCFERKLEALTKEQVLAALRASLPEDAGLEVIDFSRVMVTKGTLDFPRGGLSPAPPASPRGPVIWRGCVKYGPAQSCPVWAKVRVWVSRPQVLAARDLPVGRPIRAGDIRIGNVDGSPFTEGGASSFDEITGLAPRRPIRAGQPIPGSALEAPAEVIRGEMVGVEARCGAAFLKFEVRAEASGRAGDAIPVRNIESGKTFRAKVIRKGWVAVE